MEKNLINELMGLTKPFVDRKDLVQGPGGNTSVKAGDTMMIKASGYRFEEISATGGYSIVKGTAISRYFMDLRISDKLEEEKVSSALIQENVLYKADNVKYPRPSMETGFHAVLGKYVAHTHSVWSNLINCNQSSLDLIDTLRQKVDFKIANIPFVSPGLGLSYLIAQEIKYNNHKGLPVPTLFFLENHGIIAHGDDATMVVETLEKTDGEIRRLLGLTNDYPSTALTGQEDRYKPGTDYVTGLLKLENRAAIDLNQVLFPDQVVFFNDNIAYKEDAAKKINILENGQVIYHCGKREALSIHETLTAYLFIRDHITRLGYKIRTLDGRDIDYIHNMDMEKYRKSLMN